jgi:hypothetical protein
MENINAQKPFKVEYSTSFDGGFFMRCTGGCNTILNKRYYLQILQYMPDRQDKCDVLCRNCSEEQYPEQWAEHDRKQVEIDAFYEQLALTNFKIFIKH